MDTQKAVLVLEDGTVLQGKAYGATGTCTGEVCFNTSMTGYQEIFTDPSYTGQVLILNNCYTGNYGISSQNNESKSVKIAGLICKNIAKKASRPMADSNLQEYLEQHNIVCIYDIDTRALVSHVRNKGVMNCIISTENVDIESLKNQLKTVPNMQGLELSSTITTKEIYTVGNPNATYKVAVYDYGVKESILQCLADRDVFVKVFPAKTPLQECEKFTPNGYFMSNGPGDPATMQYAVDTVKQILELHRPLFGICLGNQLLGLANNVPTYKMHNGHRGGNHPVLNVQKGVAEISTQNHGFALDATAVTNKENIEITHINLNDKSIEGIRLKNKPAYSVQYHPEASPGPQDSRYLFDEFIEMMKVNKN